MHILTRAVLFGLLLAGFATATPAFADTISLYNWGINIESSLNTTIQIVNFTTQSSPTTLTPGIDFFALTDIAITSNPGTPTTGTIDFFVAGGLSISSPEFDFGDIDSDAFFTYTGTLDTSSFAPTFTPGVYSGVDEADPSDTVTVTITPTPEPSSLALFGTGMLGLVGMIRRKLSA